MRIVYNTAVSANGYTADEADSLGWLFAVDSPAPDRDVFVECVGAIVCGATTYEGILREEHLLDKPERWADYFERRPMFVFTTRDLPVPDGADVRLVAGPVAERLPEIERAVDGGTVWVQGGGDLAGQFLDAGALDEIEVSIAPAFLAGGAPVLPRMVPANRLELTDVERVGQYAVLRYKVHGAAGWPIGHQDTSSGRPSSYPEVD